MFLLCLGAVKTKRGRMGKVIPLRVECFEEFLLKINKEKPLNHTCRLWRNYVIDLLPGFTF